MTINVCLDGQIVKHPGATSDYTAWVTSKFGMELQDPDQDIVLEDHTIVNYGALVKKDIMAIPIPGKSLPQYQDAYNFYLSQVRITIKRAFGILDIILVSFVVLCLCQ